MSKRGNGSDPQGLKTLLKTNKGIPQSILSWRWGCKKGGKGSKCVIKERQERWKTKKKLALGRKVAERQRTSEDEETVLRRGS
jgi:hypothetical protein